MPPQNPFSSFADQNSFLGQPFLPRLGRALSGMFSSMGQTMGANPPTFAGVRPIPQGAQAPNLNPVPFLQSLNPFANTPLVRGTPAVSVLSGAFPQQPEAPTPTIPTLPSGTPRLGFDIYPTMPQRVASVNPRVATAEDIAAFRAANFTRPAQPVATTPQPETPVAPATPERVGVRTAYGMVYPTSGQEAAAQRLAQMPRMGARLAAVREQLNQQARIDQIRQGGGPQPQQRTALTPRVNPVLQQPMRASAPAMPQQQPAAQSRTAQRTRPTTGGQTTQRSWSNYTGNNPIRGRTYNNNPSSLYGFSGSGQPMVRIPTDNGDVVYDEESGRYIPV